MNDDIFRMVDEFADRNHYIDVRDKLPVFVCSVGAHLFNSINKCSFCDFDPDKNDENEFSIPDCPLRHNNHPIYTPMSRLADTRLHILMRGEKGSGKSAIVQMFLSENTGLLFNADAEMGVGFRTMVGPNSITEAGLFGSVNEEGEITGRPLARELCGGFLGFEEFSSMTDSMKKDHSVDIKNQLLTSTDNGRVNKAMKSGWVRYNTRYTIWAGTQPARFELESGLDRRFFIIDIEMNPDKELQYKRAQRKQAAMNNMDRVELAELSIRIKEWILRRQMEAIVLPPTGIMFDDEIEEWLERPDVRSFESDLFRRICIGYSMMKPVWEGGKPLVCLLDEPLRELLESSLMMRRRVMDADLLLIKDTFWERDMAKSTLLKEVEKMVTGDYQTAKRWMEENLMGQPWYYEFIPHKEGRGRRGVMCRIGNRVPDVVVSKQIIWAGVPANSPEALDA